MADPEFFILKEWAWMDSSKYSDIMLGGFVKNFADPIEAYVPKSGSPSHLKYSETEPVADSFTDFVASSYAAKTQEATATLKSLAGVSFTGETEEAVNLKGKLIRYERLEQLDDFFAKVRKDVDVKARVPNWISSRNRDEVCLIVGIMICEDVEVEWASTERKDKEGNIEIPVGMITLAAGVPNPLGDTADPQIKVTSSKTAGRLFKAKSGKSKIFALQLKTVTKGYFIKRDKLELDKKGPNVDRGRTLGSEPDEDEFSIPDDELFLE